MALAFLNVTNCIRFGATFWPEKSDLAGIGVKPESLELIRQAHCVLALHNLPRRSPGEAAFRPGPLSCAMALGQQVGANNADKEPQAPCREGR